MTQIRLARRRSTMCLPSRLGGQAASCCSIPIARSRLGAPRPTLLDWMRPKQVADLRERCRAAKLRIALAGSLGPAEFRELASIRPNWFAVRGAACEGRREGVVNAAKVRELVEILNQKTGQRAR